MKKLNKLFLLSLVFILIVLFNFTFIKFKKIIHRESNKSTLQETNLNNSSCTDLDRKIFLQQFFNSIVKLNNFSINVNGNDYNYVIQSIDHLNGTKEIK